MTYNELVDEELLKEAQEELPDIILSHKKIDSNTAYKTPVQDVDWWYVFGEPAGVDTAGDPYHGYKEGISISIKTTNKYYEITLSTEVIAQMYRTLVEEKAGTKVAITVTEASATEYEEAVLADNPIFYWRLGPSTNTTSAE